MLSLLAVSLAASLSGFAAGELTAPATLAVDAGGAAAATPIRTLLITGKNNHNWQYTSRLHKDTLEATGRFQVEICENPEVWLADADALAGFGLFVIDYNDSQDPKRWPSNCEANFAKAVESGTGVVAIHAANNAFKGWKEYEQMIGLLWRDGAGHGKFHTFDVEFTDPKHPITAGLTMKGHPDELYHGQTNPQKAKYSLLAQAMDKKDIGGTGNNEPLALSLEFGKGRIFSTLLGHVWVDAGDSKVSITDPNFKTLLARGGEWAATGQVTLPVQWSDVRVHNTLTPKESAAGWELLFDGKTSSLRGWKKTGWPTEAWKIDGGTIMHEAGKGGGDLITPKEYGDFEFTCEWMVADGANSGIIYRCTEDHTYSWETGPEMQILDDAKHPDGKKPKTRAGTLYDILARSYDVSRPAGEWNTATVKVVGTKVEHWLNGFKVVDTDTSTPEFQEAFKVSKFPAMKDYNTKMRGHIALQDHGDLVRFRNIKVRPIGQ